MSQPPFELQKYVTETGEFPFDKWFEALNAQTQARIDVRLDRVSLGNFKVAQRLWAAYRKEQGEA